MNEHLNNIPYQLQQINAKIYEQINADKAQIFTMICKRLIKMIYF